MPTRARIAAVCQNGHGAPTVEANREYMLARLDEALELKPDLVCLPEAFTATGVADRPAVTGEPLDGPTIGACARRARESRCYVVCPIHTREGGRIYNSAVVLDRSGDVLGVYRKHCPVTTAYDYSVLEDGITPGNELPVFDLDFGRIAIQICFDIGFPENWQALAEKGARLILWPSAYDGGFPLRVYAYLHHAYVMSSTRSGRSRIVDPCGEILVETTDASQIVSRDVNLDHLVYHWDWNMGVADRIRAAYGRKVDLRTWDPGCSHTVIEPVDPAITCAALQDEFGVESTAEYHNRHRAVYKRMRAGKAPEPQKARHGNRPQWSK